MPLDIQVWTRCTIMERSSAPSSIERPEIWNVIFRINRQHFWINKYQWFINAQEALLFVQFFVHRNNIFIWIHFKEEGAELSSMLVLPTRNAVKVLITNFLSTGYCNILNLNGWNSDKDKENTFKTPMTSNRW